MPLVTRASSLYSRQAGIAALKTVTAEVVDLSGVSTLSVVCTPFIGYCRAITSEIAGIVCHLHIAIMQDAILHDCPIAYQYMYARQ